MFAPRRYGSALSAERSQSFKCSIERGFIPFFIKCFRRRFYRQILYSEGVQRTPHGPEPAVQRVQSGHLYDFCNILIKCTAIPDLSIGGRCLGLRAAGPLLLSFVLLHINVCLQVCVCERSVKSFVAPESCMSSNNLPPVMSLSG